MLRNEFIGVLIVVVGIGEWNQWLSSVSLIYLTRIGEYEVSIEWALEEMVQNDVYYSLPRMAQYPIVVHIFVNADLAMFAQIS